MAIFLLGITPSPLCFESIIDLIGRVGGFKNFYGLLVLTSIDGRKHFITPIDQSNGPMHLY